MCRFGLWIVSSLWIRRTAFHSLQHRTPDLWMDGEAVVPRRLKVRPDVAHGVRIRWQTDRRHPRESRPRDERIDARSSHTRRWSRRDIGWELVRRIHIGKTVGPRSRIELRDGSTVEHTALSRLPTWSQDPDQRERLAALLEQHDVALTD